MLVPVRVISSDCLEDILVLSNGEQVLRSEWLASGGEIPSDLPEEWCPQFATALDFD